MTVYVCRDGEDLGEFSESEFSRRIFANEILSSDYYFVEGFADWKPVSDYRAAAATVRISQPPTPVTFARGPERSGRTLGSTARPSTATPEPKVLTLDMPSILGLVGSVVVTLGVFAPVVRAPIMGSINYFQNGKGDGVILLVAGIGSAFLTMRRRFGGLWLTGLVSLACPLYAIARFLYGMEQLKRQAAATDTGMFSGLTSMMLDSVELQWGLPLVIFGALILIGAAAVGSGKLKIKLG